MEKTISVDGKEIKFKATGATVRLYRQKFGKDLLLDIQKLNECFVNQKFDTGSLEVFEDFCYIMAKQAEPTMTDDVDEWFDNFGMFSIYEVMPQIIELWNVSTNTTVDAKKNNEQVSAQ